MLATTNAWVPGTWIANFQSLDQKTRFKYMFMSNSHNPGGRFAEADLRLRVGK